MYRTHFHDMKRTGWDSDMTSYCKLTRVFNSYKEIRKCIPQNIKKYERTS